MKTTQNIFSANDKIFVRTAAFILAVMLLAAGIELWTERSLLGPDGKFGWWEGSIWSSENSQRFADPYSFSHLVHGMLFYGGLWLVDTHPAVFLAVIAALVIVFSVWLFLATGAPPKK